MSLSATNRASAAALISGLVPSYHETQGQITGIDIAGALTVAQTKTGTAVVPFALDYGVNGQSDKLRQTIKATYAAPGFNANVESPIWYAPRSERRSEMRRTILAIVVAPRAVADPRLGCGPHRLRPRDHERSARRLHDA
jgi:hypothetical protein